MRAAVRGLDIMRGKPWGSARSATVAKQLFTVCFGLTVAYSRFSVCVVCTPMPKHLNQMSPGELNGHHQTALQSI